MASDEIRCEKRICVSDLNNLDEALLTEILTRLPSKAANRLNLVCKHWYSLIASDYFVRVFIHCRHDHDHDQYFSPIPRDDDTSYSIVCQFFPGYLDRVEATWVISFRNNGQYIRHRTLDLSFLPPRPINTIFVKASYDDLILCYFVNPGPEQIRCFYVCNLLTKQWVALPSPPSLGPNFKPVAFGLLCIPAPCSLCRRPAKQCLNNSCYKFMVVVMLYDCNNKIDVPLSELNVQLYSSDQVRWRNCVVSHPQKLFCRFHNTLVAYRGMLLWPVDNRILVYDPYNAPERISRVIDLAPHPPHFAIHSFQVCQGRFRVAMGEANVVTYTWELEDYDMGKWSMVLEPHEWKGGGLRYYLHIDGNFIRKYDGHDVLTINKWRDAYTST